MVFEHAHFDDHERVVFVRDEDSGLKAIIAVHSTVLGPTIGGCRVRAYADSDEALTDVLKLSRGMTYKAAMADLPFGGAKSVILHDPRTPKSRAMLLAMGRAINNLSGMYTTAEDMGMEEDDLRIMRRTTPYVAGLPEDGLGVSPGPLTALGVYHGLRAAARHKLGKNSLRDVHVSVQGAGHVGGPLIESLAADGARITVADPDAGLAARMKADFGADVVEPDAIYDVKADIFAPCAIGGTLNAATVARLDVACVAGSANNQLGDDDAGRMMHEKGILYAPDYVINAGGLIKVSLDVMGMRHGRNLSEDAVKEKVVRIEDRTAEIFSLASKRGMRPEEAADHMARERIGKGKKAWAA
ncbi:Leu/Phe/Val dehydrogenase [Caenispirillum salinarum]|uniref:Leu/Phe/Val dehydrogenase n=1 Tax=Caenispirillum salinarum TaxID=859058 RepID=UPI00384CEF6F